MRSKVLEICLNFKSFFGQSLLLWIFGTVAQFISYFCLCYATISNTSASLILAWHRAMKSCQMFLTVSCDFDEWLALWSLKILSVSLSRLDDCALPPLARTYCNPFPGTQLFHFIVSISCSHQILLPNQILYFIYICIYYLYFFITVLQDGRLAQETYIRQIY